MLVSRAAAVAGGLLACAAGAWYFLAPPRVACDSPALLQEFRDRFEANLKQARERYGKDSRATNSFSRSTLHILSAGAVGSTGSFLSCEMIFDRGDPDFTHTFRYLLGLDNDGRLTWRSPDTAPYTLY